MSEVGPLLPAANLLPVISGVILFLNLLLGFIVFLDNPKEKVNRTFLLLAVSIAAWTIALMIFANENPRIAIWGSRTAFIGASFIAASLLRFSLLFPHEEKSLDKKWKILILILPIFFSVTSLINGLMVKGLVPREGGGYDSNYGPIHILFTPYFIGFIGYALYRLLRRYRRSFGIEKIQLRYLFTGLAMAILIGSTTNLIIPTLTESSQFSRFGALSTIFFVLLTSYAILRHQLLNVKVIATELFTAAIVLTLLVEVFVADTWPERIFRTGVFLVIAIFGYYLIKGVLVEVRTREEMQSLAEQLQRTNVALKQLDAAKSDFISIASHQLRTPLTAIKGFISMVLEGSYGRIPKKHNTVLSKVYQSNERLIKVVNDLLNISRIEAGRFKYEWQDVYIDKLLKPLIERFKKQAGAQKLSFDVSMPRGEVPPIVGDPEKLSLVLGNLLDNAIHYTHEGRVTLRVSVQEKLIRIAISDTGIGLEENELRLLFRKFIRGKRVPKIYTEGSGLGLYVAKRIVQDHKGRIWAESEGRGKGSTFTIELPVKPRPEEMQFKEFIEGI